jgi:hypothetical protein
MAKYICSKDQRGSGNCWKSIIGEYLCRMLSESGVWHAHSQEFASQQSESDSSEQGQSLIGASAAVERSVCAVEASS